MVERGLLSPKILRKKVKISKTKKNFGAYFEASSSRKTVLLRSGSAVIGVETELLDLRII